MKLKRLVEVKYVGRKDIGYLLHNFFSEGSDGVHGEDFYFKENFQGADDGETEIVGITVGFDDEEDFYFIERYALHQYSDEGYNFESATLEQILQMGIYEIHQVHP